MSQVGRNISTNPPTTSGTNPGVTPPRGMCDHCHLRPKFPSYNYCGKRCGAKAAAVGSQTVMVVLMCKQCSQKPTYMNHEFCGRRCARAWATDHGQPITGSLARPPTPDPNQPTIVMGTQPQNQNMGGQTQNQQMQGGGQSQNQQTGQGGNQPGQKRGGVKGFVKGFKSLVSSNPPQQQQPQQPQQQTVTNPAQTQHPPNNASNSTLNLGSHTIPLVLRIPTGPPNQHNNRGGVPSHNRGPNKLGPFNGAYPISPPSPSDDNTATQNKGPFNGAYPSNRWSSGASLPSQPTGGSSSSIPASKPRLGPFNGAYPISPPSPTDEGSASQNEDEKPKLGPFNGAYPIATPPTQSISSGISALQTPNDTTPGTTPDTTPGTTPAQGSDDVWKALSHRTHSTDSLSYASEEEDTGAVQDQASGHEQDAVKDGDEVAVDNEDEVAVDNADTASISYSVYPPSTVASDHEGICALEGCSEPVFVDPITDLESEYCSGKHQEEAEVPKEEALCIMCHKTPRGSKDYFCSRKCRKKALGP